MHVQQGGGNGCSHADLPSSSHAPAGFAPPPVSETKKQFLKQYSRPIASIYNVVVQELLVQQHFMRFAVGYQYNEVSASPAKPTNPGFCRVALRKAHRIPPPFCLSFTPPSRPSLGRRSLRLAL
jgi:hypothetical protein